LEPALGAAAPRIERVGNDPQHFARAVATLLNTSASSAWIITMNV
jgi:hypothetical protein